MSSARSGATAVLLSDGRVLIAGGSDNNGPVSNADLFGTDGRFSSAQAMDSPRSSYAAVLLQDARVLVTGGVTSGGGITNSAEIYDPSADTWTVLSSVMGDARSGHTASLLPDGRVLLAGGQNSGGAVSSLEIFDPANNNFTSAGVMSSPRMYHAAASLPDGRVLIVGGWDGTNPLNTCDIYDPSSGSVSAGRNLSIPRMSASATTTLDGKVVVIGGSNGSNDLASAEIFDPATGRFTLSASSLSTARSGHQSFLLPNNNSILVVDGSSAGTDLNSAELYYAWADSFQSTGAMSVVRPGFAGSALTLDGHLLAAGGTGLSSTELYGFATVKTDAADYPPGTQVNIAGSGWQPGETVTLTLVEVPFYDIHGPYTAVADANGNISDGSFVTDVHDANIRFYLTAVGSKSGVQAQNTFTDAVKLYEASIAPASDTAGHTGTGYSVTIVNDPTSSNDIANATITIPFGYSAVTAGAVTSTPAGKHWTASVAAGVITISANTGPDHITAGESVTLALTATAPCANGSYQWATATAGNFTIVGAQPSVNITGSCDSTPPVITPTVSGTLGTSGWYVTDVSVSWTVTDPESSISLQSGCGSMTITSDTSGTTLTCSATSAGGTSSQSVTIKRDATPPTGVSGAASRAADHNGWFNSPISIVFTGSDSISGVASCTTTNYSGPDSSSASVIGTCTDKAGNTSSPVSFDFKFDATAPTAVALSVAAGTQGANGWYTSDVTVHTSGTETVSTLTCTTDQFQTAETAGQTFNGSCNNDAGLTTNASALTIKLDKTGPTAALSVTAGASGANGWYTSDVTVNATGTDNISGPVTCTSDQVIDTETSGTPVHGSCTNNAGLSTDAAPLNVKLDKTPPVVTLGVTAGTAGTNGWYTSDVTVHTSGTDTISNSVVCGADQFQTTETTAATFNGSCTNDAGLVGHASPLSVKLDKTGPAASLSIIAGTFGDNNWYISDVTVHASGSDSISNPVTCTADQFLTTETTGQIFHGSCTNDAGLSTDATDLTVKLDKTPPAVHITPVRGADHNSWYNHSASFTNPGTDSTSGIASCTTPEAYSGPDSASASVSATCKDNAGNTGSGTLTFMYDATAPTSVAGAASRPADHNGWYNHAVDVAFSGDDATSGIDSCSRVNYSGPDTATASVNGTCTDKAGNSSGHVDVTFKYDATVPMLTGSRTPVPNAYGWNNVDVAVNFSCSDATSGVASGPVTPQMVPTEGAGQSRSATCTDDADNTANATVDNINIDKTAPTITLVLDRAPAGTGWFNISTGRPAAHFTCSDGLSGLDNSGCPADQGPLPDGGDQTVSGTVTDKAGNPASASILHIKVDVTAPTITINAPSNNGSYLLNLVMAASYSCNDATSGVATCAGPVPNGSSISTNPVGQHSFTVNATDAAGNPATPLTYNYSVQYASNGTCGGNIGHQILQPINATGTLSVFKMGSTIPVKFRVCDANGVSIGTSGLVAAYGLLTAASTPDISVDEDAYSTTPDSAFRWDPSDQQWIFNQSTKNNPSLNHTNTSYFFGIKLNDGSWIYFQYALK